MKKRYAENLLLDEYEFGEKKIEYIDMERVYKKQRLMKAFDKF